MRVRYSTKHIISLAIVFTLLLSIVPQVHAVGTPASQYTGSSAQSAIITGYWNQAGYTNAWAMLITPNQTGTAESVTFKLMRTGSPTGYYRYDLYDSSMVLKDWSASYTITSISGTKKTNYNRAFTQSYSVTNATTYYVGVRAENGTLSSNDYIEVDLDTGTSKTSKGHIGSSWSTYSGYALTHIFYVTLPSKSWNDVSTWTASLASRTWSSGTAWSFNIPTLQWNNIGTWTSQLITRGSEHITEIEGLYADGYLENQVSVSTPYFDVWNATSSNLYSNTSIILGVGAYYEGYQWQIERTLLYFDSSLLQGGVILEANLSLCYTYLSLNKNFNLTVQNGQPEHPQNPFILSDFWQSYYSGDGGTINMTEPTRYVPFIIQLNSDGESWINKTGITKLCLRSSNDISGEEPTDYKYVSLAARELGIVPYYMAWVPKLIVRWIGLDWVSTEQWLFDFAARIWVDAVTWIFNLPTSIWNIASTWLFHLSPPQWTNVAVWIFSLRSTEWMLVALLNFQLGAGGIAFLFIAILLLIVIVAGIIAIAYSRPKR